jgi:hypothetical protein
MNSRAGFGVSNMNSPVTFGCQWSYPEPNLRRWSDWDLIFHYLGSSKIHLFKSYKFTINTANNKELEIICLYSKPRSSSPKTWRCFFFHHPNHYTWEQHRNIWRDMLN